MRILKARVAEYLPYLKQSLTPFTTSPHPGNFRAAEAEMETYQRSFGSNKDLGTGFRWALAQTKLKIGGKERGAQAAELLGQMLANIGDATAPTEVEGPTHATARRLTIQHSLSLALSTAGDLSGAIAIASQLLHHRDREPEKAPALASKLLLEALNMGRCDLMETMYCSMMSANATSLGDNITYARCASQNDHAVDLIASLELYVDPSREQEDKSMIDQVTVICHMHAQIGAHTQ